jgi:hypothetical protein
MTKKASDEKHLEPLVAVAIVLLAILLLIRSLFLFDVFVTIDEESLIAIETTILGLLGLVVVYFLGLRARRAGRQSGSSVYFVAGFLIDLLSYGIIEGIWKLVNSFFAIYTPWILTAIPLVLFGIIIAPIIVGRVWKHKRNEYWSGVLLGFAVLSIITFLRALQFRHG